MKTQSDKEEKMAVIVGDQNTWWKEWNAFQEKNTVIEKHISSQLIMVPNPKAIKAPGQEQIPASIVSAVIFYHEGKEEK